MDSAVVFELLPAGNRDDKGDKFWMNEEEILLRNFENNLAKVWVLLWPEQYNPDGLQSQSQ